MLSGTLKERLAQYKVLKEEEERNAALAAASPTNSEGVPGETWVPKIEEPDGEYEVVDSADDVEYEEEIIEETERAEDESYDEDEVVYEEQDVDCSPRGQDVFRALDEAERAESVSSSQNEGTSPGNDTEKNTASRGKQRCIILALLFFACVAIVAIVLPFFIDYRPQKSKTNPSQPSQPVNPVNPVNPLPPTSEPGPTTDVLTASPTVTPTTLRWGQFMKSFLIPLSGKEVFEDENSPQYLAAKYILDDPYTVELTKSELDERYASVTFYFATDGPNWDSCFFGDKKCKSGQWLDGNVCGWHGVTCNDYGRVTCFSFANAEGNGLAGSLPNEMYLLSELQDLIIVNNKIAGTLPEAFGEMATSMRSLLLPDNELEGTIPENYLSNSPLEFVHLGSNSFTGTVPSSFGNASYLQQLDMSRNLLTGTIPNGLGEYTVLEALSFANNKLNGKIPEEIYGLSHLKFLHLNGNELDGSISSSVGHLTSLKELRVGQSKLSGFIPDELYFLTNLVELDISKAQFHGRLSVGLLNLIQLEKLLINDNKFDGTIPNIFEKMSALLQFTLQGNELSGSVPESVCSLREDSLEVLTADCAKVTCDCCTSCF